MSRLWAAKICQFLDADTSRKLENYHVIWLVGSQKHLWGSLDGAVRVDWLGGEGSSKRHLKRQRRKTAGRRNVFVTLKMKIWKQI